MNRLRSSLRVAALIACGILAAVHAVDRGAQAWQALDRRIAAVEGLASSSYCRSIDLARDFVELQTEQRVLVLPEDGNQWHTILLLRRGWQQISAERRAASLFQSEPLLVSLKSQTHWHCCEEGSAEFEKFRPIVDATPCLIVERANGEVIYRESGPKLGSDPRGLCCAIRKEVRRHCPDGKCLPLHPVPGPKDEKPGAEIPAVLQADEPDEKPRPDLIPAAMVVAGGVLFGLFVKFRRAAQV